MDVLVVEDDASHRKVISALLTQAGFVVVPAEDGVKAFDALASRPPFHAIVCDLNLPNLSGSGFYEQIEETYPNMASRVIFVTGYADEDRVRRFLEGTGQPFFRKPYDPDELLQAVRRIAGRPTSTDFTKF